MPGKSWLKFKNRDDQSTTLSILVKNLEPSITINWSKFRPKNEAYFIKAAYRKTHPRKKFVSGKMFATIDLRKKLVSNFRNSGTGNRIRTIYFPDFFDFLNPYYIWVIRSQIFFLRYTMRLIL